MGQLEFGGADLPAHRGKLVIGINLLNGQSLGCVILCVISWGLGGRVPSTKGGVWVGMAAVPATVLPCLLPTSEMVRGRRKRSETRPSVQTGAVLCMSHALCSDPTSLTSETLVNSKPHFLPPDKPVERVCLKIGMNNPNLGQPETAS